MNIKKPLLVAGVVTSVAAASLGAAGMVSAETASTATGPDNLIKKIAQKFNLKESDVQAVFDEERTARQAEHQKAFEERLTQAVKDGKLTSEQKAKIIAKAKELQSTRDANREAMKNKTPEERKTAMEAKRTALEKWASANNIPTEYLHFGGMGGPGGPGGHGPRGDR